MAAALKLPIDHSCTAPSDAAGGARMEAMGFPTEAGQGGFQAAAYGPMVYPDKRKNGSREKVEDRYDKWASNISESSALSFFSTVQNKCGLK